MKQDMELIKLILQTLADDENYFMLSDDLAKKIQVKTNEKDAFNNKFIGHFFLAKDANLISEMSVCFFTGQGYNRAMPANGGKVRITAQGLEFLEALKEDEYALISPMKEALLELIFNASSILPINHPQASSSSTLILLQSHKSFTSLKYCTMSPFLTFFPNFSNIFLIILS